LTPSIRTEDLVVEHVDGGMVVYDQRTNAAHWLDPDAAAVCRMADGRRTLDEVADSCELSKAAVADVLLRLHGLDLLTDEGDRNVSRRAALTRIAKLGGAAAVLAPVISSVVVPSAMAAGSQCASVACSGTHTGTSCEDGGSRSAHAEANAICMGSSSCRGTSLCAGTCLHTGSSFTYSGFCVY
jgi:hypothetical protein